MIVTRPRRLLPGLVPLAASALLSLFSGGVLSGCGGDEPVPASGPATPAPGTPAPATPGSPVPAAEGPVFVSAAQCGACHKEIYEEWKASWHGQAMTDPHFLRLSDGLKQEECIRCHAPVPLREMDNWETPIARSDRREDAVSCLSCHQSGGNVAGPHGLSGPCRPVKDPAQQDVTKVCFACHNQHKTGEEWLAGPYAPDASGPRQVEARTCLDCHMPTVERPLVPGGPVRTGRRHTWPGGHTTEHVERAAKVEVETSPVEGGTRVRVYVTNVGAGHNIPTDARHRSFDVYVKVVGADGKVVLDPVDPDPARQAKAQVAKYRLNYRNSNKEDTQIPPLARVSGLGGWPGYVDVPISAGTGEAWLVYRMTPEDVLSAESLTDHAPFQMYVARRVARVPFTFGR